MEYQLKQNQFKLFGTITTSEKEIRDLIKSWIAISIAFGVILSNSLSQFYFSFIVSMFTVGVGFIFHEMGHKFMPQKYGCFAEFRSFDRMLVLAIIMSFFGFIFAAPGAVTISGLVGTRRNGKISAMGPGTNFILAALFILIYYSATTNLTQSIGFYGFFINTWLGLFNLIPVWMFDGAKILKWSKSVYALLVIIGITFLMLSATIPKI